MTTIITITGRTGSGKTLLADFLEQVAKSLGMSVSICDHHLFSHHDDFEELKAKVWTRIGESGDDLAIACVSNQDNLIVDFGRWLPLEFQNALLTLPNQFALEKPAC